MPPRIMTVNGEGLEKYGLWVVPDPQGLMDAPAREDNITRIPGIAGGLILHQEGQIATRELLVEGVIYASSMQDVHDKWAAVKRRLSGSLLEVAFAAWPGLLVRCRYQSMEWIKVQGISDGAGIRLRFLMPNPYLVSDQVDVYTASENQDINLTLGSAPSTGQLFLIGKNEADPAVEYRNAQGMLAGLVSYVTSGLLAQGSWIHFDGASYVSYLHTATTKLSAGSLWVRDNRVFNLDPNDADAYQGPTLTPLNCHLVAHVRKAWL